MSKQIHQELVIPDRIRSGHRDLRVLQGYVFEIDIVFEKGPVRAIHFDSSSVDKCIATLIADKNALQGKCVKRDEIDMPDADGGL